MQNSSSKNTVSLEDLYRIANQHCYPIEEDCPESIISMSVRISDEIKVISLSNPPPESGVTKKECLAHELGHCITDSFYRGYSPYELRSKHEHRANKWAIQKIIPFPMLCQAVKNGCRERWELAEYFSVSEKFILKAIDWYASIGKTVPEQYYIDN